jgi:hypothetical protein
MRVVLVVSPYKTSSFAKKLRKPTKYSSKLVKKTRNHSLTHLGVIVRQQLPKESTVGKLKPKKTNKAKIIKGDHLSSDETTSYISLKMTTMNNLPTISVIGNILPKSDF